MASLKEEIEELKKKNAQQNEIIVKLQAQMIDLLTDKKRANLNLSSVSVQETISARHNTSQNCTGCQERKGAPAKNRATNNIIAGEQRKFSPKSDQISSSDARIVKSLRANDNPKPGFAIVQGTPIHSSIYRSPKLDRVRKSVTPSRRYTVEHPPKEELEELEDDYEETRRRNERINYDRSDGEERQRRIELHDDFVEMRFNHNDSFDLRNQKNNYDRSDREKIVSSDARIVESLWASGMPGSRIASLQRARIDSMLDRSPKLGIMKKSVTPIRRYTVVHPPEEGHEELDDDYEEMRFNHNDSFDLRNQKNNCDSEEHQRRIQEIRQRLARSGNEMQVTEEQILSSDARILEALWADDNPEPGAASMRTPIHSAFDFPPKLDRVRKSVTPSRRYTVEHPPEEEFKELEDDYEETRPRNQRNIYDRNDRNDREERQRRIQEIRHRLATSDNETRMMNQEDEFGEY